MHKLMFLLIGLWLLSHYGCGTTATDIFAHISLVKVLANKETSLKINYFASPVGDFNIDEVIIDDNNLVLPSKKATSSSCLGIVLSAESVQYIDKIILQDNGNFGFKTIWTGDSKRELSLDYKLPLDFEIVSVSSTISSAMPFIIELKEPLKHIDWDYCYLFNESSFHKEVFAPSHGIYPSSNRIEVNLNELEHGSKNIKSNQVDITFKCVKEFKGPEVIHRYAFKGSRISNYLNYELKTKPYTLNLIKP